MLDPQLLRKDPEAVAKRLKAQSFDFDWQRYADLENRRKQVQSDVEAMQGDRNRISKQIGKLKRDAGNVEQQMEQMSQLADRLKSGQDDLASLQAELSELAAGTPNLTHESVPIGSNEDDNVEVRKWGTPRAFDFDVKDHVDLGSAGAMLDFDMAAKLTGSRFVVMQGQMARLHRALVQFMLDVHTQEHQYTEYNVPFLVNPDSLHGTGQLPKFEDDQFRTTDDSPYYLIPTAEVPLTNMFRERIVEEADLPYRCVAHTPCFRREAGSYGRDTRGMIRQHQFEKVELVHIVHPENSYEALEELVGNAEKILQKLELPYRTVTLCTGDIGFGAAKTYDIEVWLPAQDTYREISSCSNCEDFQARRMKARFRGKSGKPELVHTLNGSGLAVGRTLVAVIENYQQKDGSISVPEVLRSYLGCDRISG